jgi:hypothetical protein
MRRAEASFIAAMICLSWSALGSPVAAQFGDGAPVAEAWVKPYLETEYDALAWGCRIKHCSHNSQEKKRGWEGVPFAKKLVDQFEQWHAKEGKRIEADWRAGKVKPEDEKYLPLVKTAFWDTFTHEKIGRKRNWSIHGRRGGLPKPESPEEAEYHKILDAGLKVVHKLYNGKPLEDGDKDAFHNWLLIYYANYYFGGITPFGLPADGWGKFRKTMLGLPAGRSKTHGLYKAGEKLANLKITRPDHIWNKPDFDLHGKVFDNTWHLKPEKLDDIIATYRKFAELYYEPTDTYPIVTPRNWPEETPDTERDFTLHNFLKRSGKPVILGRWIANEDEGSKRHSKFFHLYYRALGEHVDFLLLEPGVQQMQEKNHLLFNMDDDMQARMIFWECIPYIPHLPQVYINAVPRLTVGRLNRVYLIDKDGRLLSDLIQYNGNGQPGRGDSWDHILTELLGVDAYLMHCIKDGFSVENCSEIRARLGPSKSQFGKSMALSSKNGYDNRPYNRYSSLYDIVGEVVAVDPEAHTLTVLREAFDEKNYPNYMTAKRFKVQPVIPQTKLFDRFKQEGNAEGVRTLTVKVNPGVYTFVNGAEVKDETGFRKGDKVSIMTKDGMEYPYIIRALRLE